MLADAKHPAFYRLNNDLNDRYNRKQNILAHFEHCIYDSKRVTRYTSATNKAGIIDDSERERERESSFLTTHQHILGYTVS